MRGAAILFAHSIRRIRTLILVMACLLAGFQILLTLAAKALENLNAFGQLSALIPDFLRQMMGPSLISMMSFGGIVCVGYFHMVVVGALVGLAVAVATEPASEIESKFIDLILAHPLARHWVITRTVAILAGSVTLVLVVMVIGSIIGLYWLAPGDVIRPTLGIIRSLTINLAAMMMCWGGIALALASAARRRGIPGAIAGLLALTSYLFDYVARVWKPAAKIAWLFPFHYYNAVDLLTGGPLPVRDIWVLSGIAVAGIGLAYLFYMRRDL